MAGQEGRKRGGANGGGGSVASKATEKKSLNTRENKQTWKDAKTLEDVTAEQFKQITTEEDLEKFGKKFDIGEPLMEQIKIENGELKYARFLKEGAVNAKDIDISQANLSKDFNFWLKFKKIDGKVTSIDIDESTGIATVWREKRGKVYKDFFEPIRAIVSTDTYIEPSRWSGKINIKKNEKWSGKPRNVSWEYVGTDQY